MSELQLTAIGSTAAYKAVTIAEGETLSNFADLGGAKLAGIFVPIAFTGTVLTFKASFADINQSANMGSIRQEDGTDYVVTVVAPDGSDVYSYVELPIAKFAGVKYVAIEAGDAQTEDVDIILAASLV